MIKIPKNKYSQIDIKAACFECEEKIIKNVLISDKNISLNIELKLNETTVDGGIGFDIEN